MMDKLAKNITIKPHLVGLRYFNVYGKGDFIKQNRFYGFAIWPSILAGKIHDCLKEVIKL